MLSHKGTQQIETDRLILRRFTTEDAQAMYENWASDPEVTRFLTWSPHANVEITRSTLEDWTPRYAQMDYYQWAIVPRASANAPIGSIAVVAHHDMVKSAEIGYCIGRAWWHRGIMSEALAAVIDFLFDEVGMNRIAALHDVNNPNSGKVMKKCGMRYEGTHRQAARNNQGICDIAEYAILSQDRQDGALQAVRKPLSK